MAVWVEEEGRVRESWGGAGRERDRARGRACGTAARWREAAVPLFRGSGRGARAAAPGKGWGVRSWPGLLSASPGSCL